jgi:hypothetical protein
LCSVAICSINCYWWGFLFDIFVDCIRNWLEIFQGFDFVWFIWFLLVVLMVWFFTLLKVVDIKLTFSILGNGSQTAKHWPLCRIEQGAHCDQEGASSSTLWSQRSRLFHQASLRLLFIFMFWSCYFLLTPVFVLSNFGGVLYFISFIECKTEFLCDTVWIH